jgi:4-amino-4-deoxy-L-arabinose transferase-like glycosyltransferase
MSAGAASTPGWARLGLVLALIFDVWWRCHTLGPTIRDRLGWAPYPVVVGEAEPLDCDEAAYAYIGKHLTRGQVMYRDLSENKPPLGYWLYAAAVGLGGYHETTIRLMPIPYVLATIGLVWWVGLRLRGPATATLAAWLYAVLSTDPFLFGNGANMEHFLNFFSVAALACMVRALNRRGAWPLLLAGALVAAASLVKQVAAVQGLVYVLILLPGRKPSGEPGSYVESIASRILGLVWLAVGFVSVVLVAVGILWLQGAGPAAFDDIVRYGSALATLKVPDPNAPPRLIRWFTGNADPTGRLPWPFGRTDYLVWWGTGSWPIWLASFPALVAMTGLPRSSRTSRLVAFWTLAAWVEVFLPGLFWQHYYLLPTPGLALAVSWLACRFGSGCVDGIRRRSPRQVLLSASGGILLLSAILATAAIQVRDYLLVPSEELTIRYKGGRQWVELRRLGRELQHRSAVFPSPSLYIWGWQSPLFFYSGLDGPTRHFFADPLLEDYAKGHHRGDPLIEPRVERILRDLEAHPPSISYVAYPPFPALLRFLNQHDLRSGLLPRFPNGMGLWVDRNRFGAFETYAPPGEPTAADKPAAAR